MNSTATNVNAPRFDAGPSLAQRLGRLYELAPQSDYLFGSPLGPFDDQGKLHELPHFIYFGPCTSEESLRLAIYTGASVAELPVTRAVLTHVTHLARRAEAGHGLNLSFFPVMNVLSLLGQAGAARDLARENWQRSREPEIRLLGQDARLRGYMGFVRLGVTREREAQVWVRTISSMHAPASGVELFSSVEFEPWTVRFETLGATTAPGGPLTLAEDLPFGPFEVEITLPAHWHQAETDRAVARALLRLVTRYRAFHAYGQHL